MKNIACGLLTLFCALAVTAPSWAETTGGAYGRVTDPQGNPVPHACVFAFSYAQRESTLTDAQGRYFFINLLPADYWFGAKWNGRSSVHTPSSIVAGSQRRVDINGNRYDDDDPGIRTSNAFELSPATNPIFANAVRIDHLLPFVPGVTP
jgi:protocatechuate 3,4-dioxygenase beta subunit